MRKTNKLLFSMIDNYLPRPPFFGKPFPNRDKQHERQITQNINLVPYTYFGMLFDMLILKYKELT